MGKMYLSPEVILKFNDVLLINYERTKKEILPYCENFARLIPSELAVETSVNARAIMEVSMANLQTM